MLELVVATKNVGKQREIEAILREVLGVSVRFLDSLEVEETGDTFKANALLKARAAAEHDDAAPKKGVSRIYVGEDSGICIDFLDGWPGIYSARFYALQFSEKREYLGMDQAVAKPENADAENNKKLLALLDGVLPKHRGTHYESHFVGVRSDGTQVLHVKGETFGKIGEEARGEGGFGYDPLFLGKETPGKSFGEVSSEIKNKISHRAKALLKLQEVVESLT